MDWPIVFIELVFEGICEGWFYLMQLIVPEKMKSKKFKPVLKFLIGVFSIVLIIIMLWGIAFLITGNKEKQNAGKYMIFIPFAISIIQIVGGIVARVLNKKKG